MKRNLLVNLFLLISYVSAFSQGVTLPYNTGFDSPSEIAGWQQFRTGVIVNHSWTVGGGGFSGSCVDHDYNVGANQTDTVIDWYVSPPLNMSTIGIISMKVRTAGFSTPTPDNCDVWFGTGSPDPAVGNFTLIGNISYMTPQYTWLDTSFNIPITSDSGYIAFKYKTIYAAWCTYSIDNISILPDPSASILNPGNNSSADINILPNPLTTYSTVVVNDATSNRDIEIVIYDIFGKEMKYLTGRCNEKITIEKGSFPAGLYFLSVKQNNQTLGVKKLIIE